MKALGCRITGHRHQSGRIGANLIRVVCANCSKVSLAAAPRGPERRPDKVLAGAR
jgi:hypothetical protein